MPEVIFNGPEGRLEGRYNPGTRENAPIALILHPHPQYGGTMNNKVVYYLYHSFVHRGFSVLRFNFRGVGRSQGVFDNGIGELSDAAAALDWLQTYNRDASSCWVAGFSFGAWISMQLLMRRPEIEGFISVSPPANMFDFSFLAPCPSSGLILQGTADTVVTEPSVQKLADKLRSQKSIEIDYRKVDGASHFYENHMDVMVQQINDYLTKRLGPVPAKA
ncbi:alpha/beta hydrolase [Govanella unica]|uniref:Alpha/beta hydrolase n=1 Tax=Govanella unica TaxID=2975056 RepID=A0A9X3TXL5_9PROT|nr:alpha/beta hydrolase [Govania unica]MDA5193555.1 alpha/beta hydrolase [Govania unica]